MLQSKSSSRVFSQNGKCTLENLSEGRIGKIQIMRSGKCRLVLGNVRFDLKLGTPCCFNEVKLREIDFLL